MTAHTIPAQLRATYAVIDTLALKHNLQQVRNLVGQAKIMAVIKSNAYGHGLIRVAEILSEVDAFAVACVDEAISIRDHGLSNKIIILEGFNNPDELDAIHEYDFTAVINNFYQFQLVNNCDCKINCWIKFDTGMNRLGFTEQDLNKVLHNLSLLSAKLKCRGIMSHFACADEPVNPFNQHQLKRFEVIKQRFSERANDEIEASMANSAAILSAQNSYYDWVRPGLMLFGINPLIDSKSAVKLQAVMTLKSTIIAIRQLKDQDCVGYGAMWCCDQFTTIAVVSIGYGDGYPRHIKTETEVLIHGEKVPVVGRVSMDMITVDISRLINQSMRVEVGDEVILWGQELAVNEVAEKAETISYELLCRVNSRVAYIYK